MPENTFSVEVKVENMPEFLKALESFGMELKGDMYPTIQKLANRLERDYKAATPTGKTGKLRRMTYCTATYNPLGLEMGNLAEYAYWTEVGHGTYEGGWFSRVFNRTIGDIVDGFQRALKIAVKKYQDRIR